MIIGYLYSTCQKSADIIQVALYFRKEARKRAGTRLGRLGRSTSSHVRDFLVEGNDGETRFDFLAYKRTINEAKGMAAIQNKESIKVDGKNIFPYQFENGGFKTIRTQKDNTDDTESLQLEIQGESKEPPTPEPGRIANLSPAALLSPSSPLRSPKFLIKDVDEDVEPDPTVPLTISSVKLLPINDNIDDERYTNGENIEIVNSPIKTGNSEFDIQMSPNRTKIVGGGGIIMRTASPRMRTHRRKSSSNGPKFIDTIERGPVQSDIRLDLMVTSVANMKLKKSKKKKSRHKKHSRRSKSRGSPSPHRQRRDSEDLPTPKHKISRGHRYRDKSVVTFEDKKKDIIENVETLQDRHHDSFVSPRSLPTPQSNHLEPHQQYSPKEGLNMPRELKRKKSLSNLGRSQAVDESVDDEYGNIVIPK